VSPPAASPRAGAATRVQQLGPAALAAAVLLAFAPVLWNGLVWDDVLHIADNPRVRGVGAATAYLFRPEGAYYRPLVFLGYAAEHTLWGAAPLGYHLVNLLLHVANVLGLRAVARRSGVSPGIALLAAAAFALHPLQTEAVAYVSGRTDLLMTAGALLSCAALLGSGPALRRGLAAAAAGALAMLSKESGYALLLLWPWWAWRHGRATRERLALAGPGVATGLLLLALRPGGLPVHGAAIGVPSLPAVGQALATYAGLVLWPVHLQIDRLTALPSGPAAAFGVLVLAVALALVVWGLSQRGAAGDWTGWTAAFYLPVANLVALYPAIADRAFFTPEHNLYAPLAGLAVLGAMGAERARARLAPRWSRAVQGAVLVILALWGLRTAARCMDWYDEERLFGTAVAGGAESPRVWYNYGNALLRRGDPAGAAEVLAGAVRLAPQDAAIWTNLGVAQQRLRAYEAAERAYRRAAELAPRDAQILENLGSLYLARGDLEAARAAFAAALRIDPQRATARRALRALAEHDHDH
jgi:hypothetical protein